MAALAKTMDRIGIGPERVAAWLGTWDYPLLGATMIRSVLEELPGSVSFLRPAPNSVLDFHHLSHGSDNADARNFGLEEPVPIIAMPHHENHAWFSFAVSPFARLDEPVAIAVIDGTGDCGSISLYVAEHGAMRCISCNRSVFDSLRYLLQRSSDSTQGGWTRLSSEGRFMGAAACGTWPPRSPTRTTAASPDSSTSAPTARSWINRRARQLAPARSVRGKTYRP